jgi:hypothetical protein
MTSGAWAWLGTSVAVWVAPPAARDSSGFCAAKWPDWGEHGGGRAHRGVRPPLSAGQGFQTPVAAVSRT